jgi:hypothetical protein
MTSSAPPPSLAAAIANVHVQVTPENVLEVRRVLLSEAENLMNAGVQDIVATKIVGFCGGDPISKQAAPAFSSRIAALVRHYQDYARQLRAAGNALELTARDYGYTEAEILLSFPAPAPEGSA